MAVPKIEGKSQQHESFRDSSWEAEKAALEARQAMKKPAEERSLLVNSKLPKPRSGLPYAEEYAKCGCTKQGGKPCRRCQLMLLSDRQVRMIY